MSDRAEVDPKNQSVLERLRALTREGRRPLSDFLELSEEAGEGELRAVRSFLFDLYCQIYDVDPESDEGASIRFRFLQELSKGRSLEEVASLFIGNLYLTEQGVRDLRRPTVEAEARPRPRSLAEQARQLIAESYTSRISLNSIAKELAVSKEHLSRIFKKKFGVTVTEHVHRVRIDAAKALMASGEHSLKQVCYETGYQSYNDFYRNFRKVTGSSPKEFVESGSD